MDGTVLENCVQKVGGVFKFTVLLQRRIRELVKGSTPLVAVTDDMEPVNIALKEFIEEKINYLDVETSSTKKKRSKK